MIFCPVCGADELELKYSSRLIDDKQVQGFVSTYCPKCGTETETERQHQLNFDLAWKNIVPLSKNFQLVTPPAIFETHEEAYNRAMKGI